MKIVIVGAGEVGTHLAKLLSRENQDITLIDDNPKRLAPLDANYNLLTVLGSPTSISTMRQAQVPDCDLFIAVTASETENAIACSMAKSLGATKTVSRIDNYEYMDRSCSEFFSRLGINALIYPEHLAAKEILKAMERNWVRNWFELHDGELIVLGVKIRNNAKIIGMKLRDITMSEHFFHISAIKRNHETIIPRGDDLIEPDDILYITTTKDYIEDVREICGKQSHEIHNVIIMTGSPIAEQIIRQGANRYNFKVIEQDLDTCQKLAELSPHIDVVNADARDTDTLIEEGIERMDAFIALSPSSEANILTCLAAKEYGVKKTIAEVENLQFISEAEKLNIGTIINKKLIASGKIFQILLDADVESAKFMALADADVAEMLVHEGSKITKGPVRSLNLQRDMTLAGLIRDGKGMLVDGNTTFLPGDQVVVFSLTGAIHKIEKLFI